MNDQIKELYALGLEKFAGDESQAKEFVTGFLKEAFSAGSILSQVGAGAAKAIGAGTAGLALGLGIHGVSSAIQGASMSDLKSKFEAALHQVIQGNQLLQNADQAKVRSYANTVFQFAPHVAIDPNLLRSILNNAVHGEGIDPMTIRTLADLESRVQESKKNSLFSPKAYV